MSSDVVTWSLVDGIGTVTISREKMLNALNAEVLKALAETVQTIARDPAVRGVILTGAGPKAFVAGADISELRQIPNAREGRAVVQRGQRILRELEQLRKPVIACINGFALGGGLELALACHMRFASENALLGLPEVKLGVIPGYGGTQRLSRIIGRGRALELILSGEFINAAEAHRLGLVNKLFPNAADMLEAARKTLSTIASRGPLAVAAALEAVDRGLDMGLDEGLALEADLFGGLCETADMKEGLSAFLEKRNAEFKGQ